MFEEVEVQLVPVPDNGSPVIDDTQDFFIVVAATSNNMQDKNTNM